jgi:hypothetical protein
MRHGCPVHADVELVAEFQELSARELGPVVRDDGVGHSEAVDDVGEERHRLLCPKICDGAHLHPLRELVDSNHKVGVALGRLSQGPDDIQSPHDERPCDRDGLQDVRREIGLAGVELEPFAGAHDLAGVGDRGGPVEALAEHIAYEGAGCCVVAAHARMYIPEELVPLRDGHASLQNARHDALVHLAVNKGE